MGRERESKEGDERATYGCWPAQVHGSCPRGELEDLCEAVAAKDVIRGGKEGPFPDLKELAKEVEQVM